MMNKKQEQIAKDTQKANANNMTIDELFECISDGVIRSQKSMVRHFEESLKLLDEFVRGDFEQIYEDYATQIGKDNLTTKEKEQAFLNHVLEQGLSEEA